MKTYLLLVCAVLVGCSPSQLEHAKMASDVAHDCAKAVVMDPANDPLHAAIVMGSDAESLAAALALLKQVDSCVAVELAQ